MSKEIPLTQGRVALVDAADFDRVNKFNWYACFQRGRWYALRMLSRKSGSRKPLGLHQFIMDAKKGDEVDHRDGDGLNNQKHNLRFVTRSQNNANRRKGPGEFYSRYKGVTWDKRTKRWVAQIQNNRERFFLGRFDIEDDAARAYNNAAQQFFGEFARLNLFV